MSRAIDTPEIGTSRRLSSRRYAVLVAPFVLALVVVVIGGYLLHWHWTGYLSPEQAHTPRTLWDWLGLFLVPFLLPLALVFLDVELEHRRAGGVVAATPPQPSTGRVGWSPLRTAVVAGALVVAGFAGGWIAHISAHDTAPAASPAAPAETSSVTVNATDPDWTNTHLAVRKGQRVEVSAFGLARSSARGAAVGPGGEPRSDGSARSIVPAFPHLALLATVAPPGTQVPLDTRALRQRVVDVGAHRVFTAPADGELLLGVNDTASADNRGWFGATVHR